MSRDDEGEAAAAPCTARTSRAGSRMPSDLLDERLEWPLHKRTDRGPWRLGHGLTVVGPGWWPLVRQVFAAVAETPGATVAGVRQKCAMLEVRIDHPNPGSRARLGTLTACLTQKSRSVCEACGGAVPAVDPAHPPWRNHCPAC